MWHFSDFGHEKLAEVLAPQIRKALDLPSSTTLAQ
jgi:hypothetical protein